MTDEIERPRFRVKATTTRVLPMVETRAEGEPRPGPWYLPITGGWLPADVGSSWNWWQQGFDVVSPGNRSAMVEACVSAYSQTVAMCPGDHWISLPNGGRERVTTSALYRILRKPNRYQNISDFLLNAVRSLYLTGNTYALALRNARYEISELHLMDSKRCSAFVVHPFGDIFYQLGGNEIIEKRIEPPLVVPARDVLHIRLHTPRHPLKGETPLAAAAMDIAAGDAIAAQQIAFYLNQARPSTVLATDQVLTPEQVHVLRERWNEQARGLNQGGTPILSAGLKPLPLTAKAEDSQLAEVLKMSRESIALTFRIPLQILGIGGTPFASTEALMQSWKSQGLGFCLNHIEEAFGALFELRGYSEEYVEFNTDALMRSAFKDRVDAYARGVQGGIFEPNFAREEFGLPKAEFGDEPRLQAQVVPLSAASGIPTAPPSKASLAAPAVQIEQPPAQKLYTAEQVKSIASTMMAAAARRRHIDFVQDPATGRFEGSREHHGDDGSGGDTFGFVSPNVRTNLNLPGAVRELKSKQQHALTRAADDINKKLGIGSAQETAIVGAWADGAENSLMMHAKTDWDHAVLAQVMKGHLANQKSVLVFQPQEGGASALLSFEAKGDIKDIHDTLLKDGIEFHTLEPHAGGATVHVAAVDDTSIVYAVRKDAERYGSEVKVRYGRGKFIGDTSGEGTDSEQRERARGVYENHIRESKVEGGQRAWDDIRDRWRPALGGLYQQVAEQALSDWKVEHPKVKDKTVALNKDLDQVIAEGDKYKDYRDWYARHKPLARELFGDNEPYFEKFLAATSINSGGKDNVVEGLRATIHYVNGGTFEKGNYEGVTGSVRDQLLRIQRGEPIAGMKVVPFEKVLQGDWDHAPADRHMKNILFQNPSLTSPSQSQADATEVVIRAMAKSMGWKTAELQAVVWCVDKARQKNKGSAVIFDYLQYMQQEEVRVRTLLAAHKKLKTRVAYSGKSADEDQVEKNLTLEAQAWSNAQLLMRFFLQLQKQFGDELSPEKILAELGAK